MSEAIKIIAVNRKARFDYELLETFEAGMVLVGTEVKSLRAGHGTIADAFAQERDGEIYLMNARITEYPPAGKWNHEPMRMRKLLLHRKELGRLLGEVRQGGMTIVPLSLYLAPNGKVKVELALAKGRKNYDKRQAVKVRDWQRNKARLMRERG